MYGVAIFPISLNQGTAQLTESSLAENCAVKYCPSDMLVRS
jgi:hypothetical protein